MGKILVSGSLAYDLIMDFPGRFQEVILPDKIHILNVSFGVENLKKNFGGTSGNIAYNLALFGLNPVIVGSAGSDIAPYRKWLKEHRVNTAYIKTISKQITATAYIITDQANNQITGFYPGALKFRGPQLSKHLLKGANLAIVAPGNVEDMVEFPRAFKRYGLPYIFDPGQSIPLLSKKSLADSIRGANVLIANDYEVSLILKKISWSKEKLLRNAEIVVTTLGEKGSRIERGGTSMKIPPALPRNISDPTGAGDAYRAGFIFGLLGGYPLKTTGRIGSLAAVYTVEKYGTQTHTFTWRSFARRYKQNFGQILP